MSKKIIKVRISDGDIVFAQLESGDIISGIQLKSDIEIDNKEFELQIEEKIEVLKYENGKIINPPLTQLEKINVL